MPYGVPFKSSIKYKKARVYNVPDCIQSLKLNYQESTDTGLVSLTNSVLGSSGVWGFG